MRKTIESGSTFNATANTITSYFLRFYFYTIYFVLFLASTPILAQVYWYADPAKSVTQNFRRFDTQVSGSQTNCSPLSSVEPTATVVNDPVYGEVWKIHKNRNRKRAEFARTYTDVNQPFIPQEGEDYYYSWRWKISSVDNINNDIAVFQWKTDAGNQNNTQNYPLTMGYGNGTLELSAWGPYYPNWNDAPGSITNRQTTLWSQAVPKDEWVTISLHINVSRDDTEGFVELWFNGEKQVLANIGAQDYTVTLSGDQKRAYHKTMDGQEVYPKWGAYNSNACPLEIDCYFAEMRVTNTLAEAGFCTAGASCDDGDPNTIDDVQDENCNCSGSPIDATTVCFEPTDDAYLEGSTRFNASELRVEAGNRVSYLKFDLSNIGGELVRTQLNLTVGSDIGNGLITVERGNSNNWTENSLSNLNKPSATAQVGQLNTSFGADVTYSWPLSSIDLGAVNSLIVSHLSGNDVSFVAHEGANNRPSLCVTVRNLSLPLELDYFSGKTEENYNLLSWRTITEEQVEHIELERAAANNVNRWTTLVTFLPQAQGRGEYQWEDKEPLTNGLYRLRTVDVDGSVTFSDLVQLVRDEKAVSTFVLYPNPGRQSQLQLAEDWSFDVPIVLSIHTLGGTLLWRQQLLNRSFNLPKLPAGVYLVSLKSGQNFQTQRWHCLE